MHLSLAQALIRSWHPDDVPALVRYANNRRVWINLRDRFPHPYTDADARAWLSHLATLRPETHFALAVDGEAVGGIGLELRGDIYRRSAEIGYWLGEPFWGRGIATEAVRALTRWTFENSSLLRITAEVFEWNPASRRVLEKAGYVLEGRLRRAAIKDGKVIDLFLYAALRPSA